MRSHEVNMSDAFKGQTLNITVDVKVLKDWRFRIAFTLMRFSGWMMGASVKAASFRPRTIIRFPGGHWHFFEDATAADQFLKGSDTPYREAFNVTDCIWHSENGVIDSQGITNA